MKRVSLATRYTTATLIDAQITEEVHQKITLTRAASVIDQPVTEEKEEEHEDSDLDDDIETGKARDVHNQL